MSAQAAPSQEQGASGVSLESQDTPDSAPKKKPRKETKTKPVLLTHEVVWVPMPVACQGSEYELVRPVLVEVPLGRTAKTTDAVTNVGEDGVATCIRDLSWWERLENPFALKPVGKASAKHFTLT